MLVIHIGSDHNVSQTPSAWLIYCIPVELWVYSFHWGVFFFFFTSDNLCHVLRHHTRNLMSEIKWAFQSLLDAQQAAHHTHRWTRELSALQHRETHANRENTSKLRKHNLPTRCKNIQLNRQMRSKYNKTIIVCFSSDYLNQQDNNKQEAKAWIAAGGICSDI